MDYTYNADAETFARLAYPAFLETIQKANSANFEIVPDEADFSMKLQYLKYSQTEADASQIGSGSQPTSYYINYASHAVVAIEVYDKQQNIVLHNVLEYESAQVDSRKHNTGRGGYAVSPAITKANAYKESDQNLISRVSQNLVDSMSAWLPIRLELKEILKKDDKKISRVLVGGGKTHGLHNNIVLLACTPTKDTIQGKIIETNRLIATSEKIENITETTCEAAFKKGGIELKKAIDEKLPIHFSLYVNGGYLEKTKMQHTLISDVVYMAPLANKGNVSPDYSSTIAHMIHSNALDQTRIRFVQDRATKEPLTEAQIVEKAKQAGAKYIFFPTIHSYKESFGTVPTITTTVLTSWYAVSDISFRLVETATGKEIASPEEYKYNVRAPLVNIINKNVAPASSLCDVYYLLDRLIGSYVNTFFVQHIPLKNYIKAITDKSKKGEAERVIIDLGYEAGFQHELAIGTTWLLNIPLDVFEVVGTTPEGEPILSASPVASLAFKDVEGDYRSDCKVKDGGGIIAQNFAAGKKMMVRVQRKYLGFKDK